MGYLLFLWYVTKCIFLNVIVGTFYHYLPYMVVDEEIPPPPPHNVERFECLEKAEKRYINVMNYYYYTFNTKIQIGKICNMKII